MPEWEGELESDLKNYSLQIMGYKHSFDGYNTEASVRYLQENSILDDDELENDIDVMVSEGFLEEEQVSRQESSETDYLLDETRLRLTEEGQELIEDRNLHNLADSARTVRFKRTEVSGYSQDTVEAE